MMISLQVMLPVTELELADHLLHQQIGVLLYHIIFISLYYTHYDTIIFHYDTIISLSFL